jgi:hypothetical protein
MDRRVEVVRSLAHLAIRAAGAVSSKLKTFDFLSAESIDKRASIISSRFSTIYTRICLLAILLSRHHQLHGVFSRVLSARRASASTGDIAELAGTRWRVPHCP